LSTDVSEVRDASIIRAMKMEAARTSETSVGNYFAWQYISEDKSELHTRRRENLKSHIFPHAFVVYLTTLFSNLKLFRVKLASDR
jgi:hypothetical protein